MNDKLITIINCVEKAIEFNLLGTLLTFQSKAGMVIITIEKPQNTSSKHNEIIIQSISSDGDYERLKYGSGPLTEFILLSIAETKTFTLIDKILQDMNIEDVYKQFEEKINERIADLRREVEDFEMNTSVYLETIKKSFF